MRRRDVFDPMQVYRNRDYSCTRLSKVMFKTLNESGLAPGTVLLSCCGCIDALDSLPAGAMHSSEYRDGTASIVPTYFSRTDLENDIGPAERRARDEFARQIIERILAEEKA